MATSSIAQVIDLSLAKLLGMMPFGFPAKSDQIYIVDGSPGPNRPPFAIYVMADENDETRGTEEWEDSVLGRIENYDIQIRVWRFIGGGPDPNKLSTAQSQARSDAASVEAQIEQAFLEDPNLSTQLGTGALPITWMLLSGVSYSQTKGEEDDGKGRYSQYDLTYHIYNYLSGPGS